MNTKKPPKNRLAIWRWRALVPLGFFLVLLVAVWLLFVDTLVRVNAEAYGTDLIGAKVEIAEADVRLRDGTIALRGLQVTNPYDPMTNLFEANEVIADFRTLPLTERKIFLDSVRIRGVQLGTARARSGAVANPSAASQQLRGQIDRWAQRLRIPAFSLEGLGELVGIDAISPDSLRTLGVALALAAAGDSARSEWENQLAGLNPTPTIDSARALAQRLSRATLQSLGVQGALQAIRSSRQTLTELDTLRNSVSTLDSRVKAGIVDLVDRAAELDRARAQDLAYAKGLLRLPSLDMPNLSASIFGEAGLARLRPILFWMGMVERYMPPGLNPRRRPGANLTRRPGSTIGYPKRDAYPSFTLAHGAADLEIGGAAASAGKYSVLLSGVTTAPTVLGTPLRVELNRSEGVVGPRSVDLAVLVDHVTALRDSVRLVANGVSLPTLSLGGLGALVNLGDGTARVSLAREGDSLRASLWWKTATATWERGEDWAGNTLPARVSDALWRSLARVSDVDVEFRLSGTARAPQIGVRSNIGGVLATSLRRELSDQIAAAEAEIRGEVDRLIGEGSDQARNAVTRLEETLAPRVAEARTRVEAVRAELEANLQRLTRLLPPGVRIPR